MKLRGLFVDTGVTGLNILTAALERGHNFAPGTCSDEDGSLRIRANCKQWDVSVPTIPIRRSAAETAAPDIKIANSSFIGFESMEPSDAI